MEQQPRPPASVTASSSSSSSGSNSSSSIFKCVAKDTLWRPPEYSVVLKGIQEVVKRTPEHEYNLSQCSNLAPAHTASTSLTELLHPHSRLAHHRHRWNVRTLFQQFHVRCFVMTLRDPVARLRSAFDFERKQSRPGREAHLVSRTRRTANPTTFVDALRNPSYPSHAAVVRLYNGSLHTNAVWTAKGLGHLDDPDNFNSGNSALVPQIDYLVGIDAIPRAQVHIICASSFRDDWDALLTRLHVEQHATMPHKNPSRVAGNATHQEHQWLYLAADELAYIEHCMYPEDVLLHSLFCTPAGGG